MPDGIIDYQYNVIFLLSVVPQAEILRFLMRFTTNFALKTTFPKADPNVISYTDFSSYSEEDFGQDLKRNLGIVEEGSYDKFENVVMNTFRSHAPLKKITVRANQKPYMTKK